MMKFLQVISFSILLSTYGFSAKHFPAPELPADCMVDAKIYPSRDFSLKMWPKDSVIVELGVYEGNFSKKILDVTSPSELYLLDIDMTFFKKENIAGFEQVTHFEEGDSSELLGKFPNDFFDVIYIDADHRYEGCRKDAYAAFPKLKRGGLLVFNDYTHLDHFACPPSGMVYGVPRVAHEMVLEFDLKVAYMALQQSGFHDFALIKSRD